MAISTFEQARNSNTPSELLAVFVNDRDYGVLCEVAETPNTPQELLEVLATCEYYGIRSHNHIKSSRILLLIRFHHARRSNS